MAQQRGMTKKDEDIYNFHFTHLLMNVDRDLHILHHRRQNPYMASVVDLPHFVPQLPAEIWRIVFANLDPTAQDLVRLWLNYRLVSKLFKEEVEHLFAKKFIPNTSLLISSGTSGSSLYADKEPVMHESQSDIDTETPENFRDGTAREKLSISWWEGLSYSGSFTFERFSEQRHRAVIRCDLPSDSYTSNLFQTLKDQELLQNVMKKPYHQMSMRQRINHIPLPDLIVDVVEHTLALDWRQLLSGFFAEEKKKYVG